MKAQRKRGTPWYVIISDVRNCRLHSLNGEKGTFQEISLLMEVKERETGVSAMGTGRTPSSERVNHLTEHETVPSTTRLSFK